MRTFIFTVLLGYATCASSFAQGNFWFANSPSSAIWEITPGGSSFKAGPVLEVAVLWTANLSAVPTTYLGGAATPTNGPFIATWTGIFTDPNFQLALDTAGGNPVIENTAGGVAPFAGLYNGGVRYIYGSSVGQQIQLYVIAWEKSFGTDPLLAALAGSHLGCSAPIQYTLGSAVTPGPSLGAAGIGSFGIVTPEPGTFTLACLGAATLLILRRCLKI